MLISTGLCAFLTVKTISEFLSYEKFNKYGIIYETSSTFPAVSICNKNAFVTEEAFEFVGRVLGDTYFSEVLETDQYGPVPTNEAKLMRFFTYKKFQAQSHAMVPNVSDEMRKSFGIPFNNFVLSCFYKTLPCTQEDFVWYYDIEYGEPS